MAMNFLNNSLIGVLISIILIYALLSIVVSILVEWWNHIRKSRGIMLKQAIMHMLDDKMNLEFGKLFFNHPMISGMKYSVTKRPPQYISSSMFADVLIDIISQQVTSEVKVKKKRSGNITEFEIDGDEDPQLASKSGDTIEPLVRFKKVLDEKLNESPFRDLLLSFYTKAEGKYEKLKILLEKWYNDQMDRVSGWYKTRQKNKFLVAGFIIAIALNVDSIYLFRVLNLNKDLTDRMVTVAEGVADNYETLLDSQKLQVEHQIAVFKTSLEEKKDSLLNPIFTGSLDTVQLNLYYQKLDTIVTDLDSIHQQYYESTKQVISLVDELGIPVGWSHSSAPVSWIVKDTTEQKNLTYLKTANHGLYEYLERRDFDPRFWDYILYVLGLIITAVSLSFGAPFWFDALMKVVNIRRAGTKPAVSSSTK